MSDVLVIDTSTNSVAVACGSSTQDSASKNVAQQSFHSENILTAIDEVIQQRETSISEISAIGVGIGPGLFTGLRVGISAAHAFAHALGIPLVCFSSLELTAISSIGDDIDTESDLIVARDARRHELYNARFSLHREPAKLHCVDTTYFSTMHNRTKDESLISPEDFVEEVNNTNNLIVVLDDESKYEEFSNFSPSVQSHLLKAQIDSSHMINHVVDSVMAGIVSDPYTPSALYIRKSDAELSWGVK